MLLAALLALAIVVPERAHAVEELQWTGCGITKAAFMAEAAAAFEKKTGTKIALSGGGAARGIRAVAANTAHLGGTCRGRRTDLSGQPIPEEKDARLIPVAWDALVVIVHPVNPLNDISLESLKNIYMGDVISWDQIGGEAKKIALVDREGKDSGVGNMFRTLAFGDPNFDYQARALKVKSSDPVEQKVETFPTAMALDGVSSARKRTVKILSLDGVAPTKENIRTAKYALYRPLYITVNRKQASPEALAFVDFLAGPEGQAIISAEEVVNLKEGEGLAELWRKRFGNREP